MRVAFQAFVVFTDLINVVLCSWKQTSPQIPFKHGCGIVGHRPLGLAWDHCTSFTTGKCLCKSFDWNLATRQRAKNAAWTIPPTLFLMVVHRGNNHKKPGSPSEWLLTFVSYSNHSPNAGQFPLNMQNCRDKMWDLPFSMHIKDTCHQDVTQELWEQEVQFLRDRLTHHQNHEIRPGKISLWWEKCYTLVHFAYKKKLKRMHVNCPCHKDKLVIQVWNENDTKVQKGNGAAWKE